MVTLARVAAVTTADVDGGYRGFWAGSWTVWGVAVGTFIQVDAGGTAVTAWHVLTDLTPGLRTLSVRAGGG